MEHEDLTKDLAGLQRVSLIVGVIGAAATAYGYTVMPESFYVSWLMAFLYWFAIAGGSLALMLLIQLTAGQWGFMILRPVEAAAKTIPLMALFFLPIAFGLEHLYEWARPEALHDKVIQLKVAYLNTNGFLIRAAGYFIIWTILAYVVSALSNRQDKENDPTATNEKMRTFSGPGLAIYVLTVTFAAFDWGMSLTPHWFSTMYGALFLAGQGVSTFAFMAIIAHKLGHRKPVSHYMNHQHFHDVGTLMFAFTILYTYMAIGEYIIVWSANLPEETEWFLERTGDWKLIAVAIAVLQFLIPFLLLLNKPIKRHSRYLWKVAVWVLAVRYIGVFWMVGPTFRHHIHVNWLDLAAWLAIGGLWLSAFFGFLKSRPLLPEGDPRFKVKFGATPAGH